MFKLLYPITINEYHRLLDLCFEYSESFSLTRNHILSDEDNGEEDSLVKALIKFEITSFHTRSWHGYYQPDKQFPPFKIYIYKANGHTKETLKKYYDNLFMWNSKEDFDFLHDLCFFKNNTLLLGTISHEDMCHFFPFDEGVQTQFLSLGKWKYSNCHEGYQTMLNQDYMPVKDSNFLDWRKKKND